MNWKVEHVDCTKDTGVVLRSTIGPLLNESLRRIANAAECRLSVFISNTPNAQEPAINNQPAALRRFALFGGATVAGQLGTLLGASKSVRLFITGDLAFYATIQGKEHMSGTWCPYCDLQHTSWQTLGHSSGNKWTIEALEAHLHKHQVGTLDKKNPRR
jgi:hypothetical protein